MSVYITDLADRILASRGSVKTAAGDRGHSGSPGNGPSARREHRPANFRRAGFSSRCRSSRMASFQLTVPASTPIQLQLLDEQGIAVRSCGWIWARIIRRRGASAATKTRS